MPRSWQHALRGAVLCALAIAAVVPSSAAARQSATPLQIVLKPSDLPAWKYFVTIRVPSQDIIRNINPVYPATTPRARDGASSSFGNDTTSLQAFVALAPSSGTARATVRAFHTRTKAAAVALGAGGFIHQASGISAGSEIVWSSGRYVFLISMITQGKKPALNRAGLVALARHMQRRAT